MIATNGIPAAQFWDTENDVWLTLRHNTPIDVPMVRSHFRICTSADVRKICQLANDASQQKIGEKK